MRTAETTRIRFQSLYCLLLIVCSHLKDAEESDRVRTAHICAGQMDCVINLVVSTENRCLCAIFQA